MAQAAQVATAADATRLRVVVIVVSCISGVSFSWPIHSLSVAFSDDLCCAHALTSVMRFERWVCGGREQLAGETPRMTMNCLKVCLALVWQSRLVDVMVDAMVVDIKDTKLFWHKCFT